MATGDLPKYQSIANDLRGRIERGELRPGDRLAAQHAMAARYDVTVMTLRQALAALEREGLVHAAKGKGTFVSTPPAVPLGIDHLWSFAEEMRHQGIAVSTEVLRVETDSISDDVGHARLALDLGDDDPVVEVVRRRSIDATPAVVQRSFLAATTWQAIAGCDLSSVSLYAALATEAGLVLSRASEAFSAVGLDEEDARLLASAGGAPGLRSIRTSFDGSGRPFLHDRAIMLGSMTEVRAERTPDSLRMSYGAQDLPATPD
jgi:GntR family transcriptional regulator